MSKVIFTDKYCNKCECGESVILIHYTEQTEVEFSELTKEQLDNLKEIDLNICKCGIIYIAKQYDK